jgi:hypothetical protein
MTQTTPEPTAPACCAADGEADASMTKEAGRIAAIAAPLLAFLASQHHTIMMTLFAFGMSNTAMSFMTAVPWVRDAMLGMSLAMVVFIGWRIKDRRRPRSMRVTGAVSIVATLALAAWSISQFGL